MRRHNLWNKDDLAFGALQVHLMIGKEMDIHVGATQCDDFAVGAFILDLSCSINLSIELMINAIVVQLPDSHRFSSRLFAHVH